MPAGGSLRSLFQETSKEVFIVISNPLQTGSFRDDVWRFDGTQEGTFPVLMGSSLEFASISRMTLDYGNLYLIRNVQPGGRKELWVISEKKNGTKSWELYTNQNTK